MTDSDIRTAVRAFCLRFCAGLTPDNAVAAWTNRTPSPRPGESWCRIGVIGSARTSGNVTTWDGGTYRMIKPTQYHAQVDFVGPEAEAWAETFATVWRDAAGCDFLAAFGCAPLYADDPRNLTQAGGEGQYEPRFEVDAYLAGRSVAATDLDFFTGVDLSVLPNL